MFCFSSTNSLFFNIFSFLPWILYTTSQFFFLSMDSPFPRIFLLSQSVTIFLDLPIFPPLEYSNCQICILKNSSSTGSSLFAHILQTFTSSSSSSSTHHRITIILSSQSSSPSQKKNQSILINTRTHNSPIIYPLVTYLFISTRERG